MHLLSLVLSLVLSLAGHAYAQPPAPRTPTREPRKDRDKDKDKGVSVAQNPNDCAVASAAARYVGYGYTHAIVLKNGCEKPIECQLWTDVDPEPRTSLSLAAGESGEVVTRRGSPSREFTALKQCSFR